MKHSISTPKGELTIRKTNGSIKLFLTVNGETIPKRIDTEPLKPGVVTSLLQEIISLRSQLDNYITVSEETIDSSLSTPDWRLDPVQWGG